MLFLLGYRIPRIPQDRADSAILVSSSKSEDVDVVGDSNDSVSTESSQPNSRPAYAETYYTNVEGVAECGFSKIPPVERMLMRVLCQGQLLSLKTHAMHMW